MLTRQVAGRVYNYDYCMGRSQVAGRGFGRPLDFARGSGDSLYVVSRGHEFNPGQGITKCTLNHELIWEDRGPGFAKGRSTWPVSVGLDSHENVYISDDYTSEIFMYDVNGEFLGQWPTIKGSRDGELQGPSGLAFDNEDNLYIVDSLNHRVQMFDIKGKLLTKWGSQGSSEGEFNMPWGISIDKQGDVYVADWRNSRVQKFAPDGGHLASFGRPGNGEGELFHPSGVAIDSEGDVYVADCGNHRLNIYTPEGVFLTEFLGDAEQLSPWAQATIDVNPDYAKARRRADQTVEWRFRRPVAVNVDDDGRIMVLETMSPRIQIYVKERDFVDAQFNL